MCHVWNMVKKMSVSITNEIPVISDGDRVAITDVEKASLHAVFIMEIISLANINKRKTKF